MCQKAHCRDGHHEESSPASLLSCSVASDFTKTDFHKHSGSSNEDPVAQLCKYKAGFKHDHFNLFASKPPGPHHHTSADVLHRKTSMESYEDSFYPSLIDFAESK